MMKTPEDIVLIGEQTFIGTCGDLGVLQTVQVIHSHNDIWYLETLNISTPDGKLFSYEVDTWLGIVDPSHVAWKFFGPWTDSITINIQPETGLQDSTVVLL